MEKKTDCGSKFRVVAEAFLVMAVLQGATLAAKKWIWPLVPDEAFGQRMVTACIMLLLTVVVFVYAKLRGTPLSVFPHRFGKWYVASSCVALALLVSSPSNFSGGCQPVLLAVYGSIITPVYEELLFRGYLWNHFAGVLSSEKVAFVWNVVLFTVWHLGYMTDFILAGNWNAVAWKLAAGLGYGVVLGLIRLKTKNCYSTMLAHGVLNIFMI